MEKVATMIRWLNRLFGNRSETADLLNTTKHTENENAPYAADKPRICVAKKEVIKEMNKNPLIKLEEIELRDLSKHQIDALEQWCRRLIDDIFKKNYGNSYVDAEVQPGQPLIKASIKRMIEERRKQDPTRFPRWIDGIVMEDLEYFICRDDLYGNHFKGIFEPFYSSREEIRSVLQRLTAIRNRIAHVNAISVHEAEQALCYSNDIINCCKMYYTSIGKDREYNVPIFTRIKDSLGNDHPRARLEEYPWEEYFYGGPRYDGGIGNRPKPVFHSGESYKVWVEVDGSFNENAYTVSWKYECGEHKAKGQGNCVEISFTDDMVSYPLHIQFSLKTVNSWHRMAAKNCDDILEMNYECILPPVSSY